MSKTKEDLISPLVTIPRFTDGARFIAVHPLGN